MLQEQNPLCVGLKGMWVANQYQGRLCGLIGGIIDPLPHVFPFAGIEAQFM